ncbi:unnamed protein product [Closterium sp. NIES-54]
MQTVGLHQQFYILVYVDDLVFATTDTAGLAHVKSELQKRHTCTDLGELRSYLGLQITRDRARRTITLTQSHMVQQVLQRFDFTYSSPQATPLSTRHSLSALPSDESVEPSGPYLELVGCLMYLMTCTRPDLAYPLSILARYVAPGRHRPEHMAAAKRVLRYLCSTSGLGLVLGGRSPVVLTGHADASWVDDLATQRSSQGYTFSLGSGSVSWRSTRSSSVLSSSCEAEIYAGAMAAQELRWLTNLLIDLGEPPRSPPVLYVDNKAMLALCREHRLEHRTKHIALCYFLARELQQRGQLRLTYVASQANTADIFTKALQPCDHERFCTMLAPSGTLSGLYLPSFSTNLVSGADLQDRGVDQFTPASQRVTHCTCARTGRHLATFTRRPGSSLYTLTTAPPPVTESGQVAASSQVVAAASRSGPESAPCSCRLLSHQTLLWHHRLGHPSLPRLRGMASRVLVSGLPRSLPPLPPGPAPTCVPCVEGRQRAAPHSSEFPPTEAPLQTLHMDVWGPAHVRGQGQDKSVCPPPVGGECALSTDVLEDRQEEFQCFAAALPHLVSTLLAPDGDPDAPDIPTPRSYAEAIEGSPPVFKARYVAPGFSQRQGVDYFQTFSPTPKITTLRVLLHVAAQRDYELHSLDFSTAFLQGSLHEEIWLRCPPGFTGSFPPGTQWSLRRPIYGLRQAPREWHDTLRTTLAALGFAPSTADPSLFLRTDTSLPPLYILVYVDDLVFATADTAILAHSHMVQQVLQRFDFMYSSPQATPLSTRHSLSALPSDESVEPSGPYLELVGCLMVLRYLCSTSGLGLVLGGRSLVVLTGHADASWVDDLATQRSSQGYTFSLGSGSVSWRSTRSSSVLSSSCEAEIYAGAMATQELHWLTYLLTDLGEPPRSPPVLYVDNKAMLALCREHRLEHRTKHIALRYFLARELQQRGQLRLAYVASQANTADMFTKALQPCNHQRFCTMLGLVPTWPHLLTS